MRERTRMGPYNRCSSVACTGRGKALLPGDTRAKGRVVKAARKGWSGVCARARVGGAGGVTLTALKFAAFGLLSPDPPKGDPLSWRFVLKALDIIFTALVSQSSMGPQVAVAVAEFCTQSVGAGIVPGRAGTRRVVGGSVSV